MGNIEKFDSIANQYDTLDRIEIARIIAETIRSYVVNGNEKTAIDYGCGTGLIGMQLLNDFDSILFIDASSNMVEQVKQKLGQLPSHNADALCCDLEKEYTAGIHADYIIMAQTLLHIKDVESIISRLYSVLNNGGHLLIVDFDKNNDVASDEVHNGFEQEKIITITKKAGFVHAETKTFYHGKRMFMGKDASLFIMDAVKQSI